MKRKPRNVPSWDDYFMGLAFFYASRSKDPDTQIGAIIANDKHRLIATGYNGPPAAYIDTEIDWSRPNKYPYIIHAEENAINMMSPGSKPEDCTIYVSGPPCSGCVNRIIERKIKRIVFGPQRIGMVNEADWQQTKDMIAKARGVTMERFQGNLNWMRDRLQFMLDNMAEVFQPIVSVPV